MIYNETIVIESEILIDNKIGISIACGINLDSLATYTEAKRSCNTQVSDTLTRGNDHGKEESQSHQD
jgi:hypothetical protein